MFGNFEFPRKLNLTDGCVLTVLFMLFIIIIVLAMISNYHNKAELLSYYERAFNEF